MGRELGRLSRRARIASRFAPLLPGLLAHGAALALAGLLLVSAGQPLFAEDTWWHLAMGRAYLAAGPWLPADPTLHTAPGPPAPAAWLGDLALYGVERAWGFQGLRAVQAGIVAAILALAWSALRRASGSRVLASLGTGLFVILSAYRLFQLRPHLVTLLATLLLIRLLIQSGEPPSWRRVAAAVGLLGLWANLHGGFLLGPFLLAAAVAGLLIAAPLRPEERARDWLRARGLTAALALGLLATLVNPAGARQHGLYFAAGSETPALELVADEWAPVHLFRLPVSNVPPSPLAWALVWSLLLVTPCALFLQLRRRRTQGALSAPASPAGATAPFDPALVGVAAASLLALLSAVRLLWLGIFPLLVVGQCARALGDPRRPCRLPLSCGAALAALLLVPGFVRLGDWPMISQGIHRAWYGQPYLAVKYYAHAVWFLRDAELEGRLFNDYSNGNFLGYWLSPRMRVFVNGSLNVPVDVMEARRALLERRGAQPGERFVDLLDRYGVDVFFAKGVPSLPHPTRPEIPTTTHLEGTPGWIPVFRNMRSAVYLRDGPRNRANLKRVAGYYARQGVPFDPDRGFDPERAIGQAPRWALDHGLIPMGFRQLEGAARAVDPKRRRAAQERLAGLYAVLGLYPRGEAMDRRLLRSHPGSVSAARRLVWSLLHQRRVAESLEAAEQLAAIAPPDDGLSRLLVDVARRHATLVKEAAALVKEAEALLDQASAFPQEGSSFYQHDAPSYEQAAALSERPAALSREAEALSEEAAALVALVPVFTRAQGRQVLAGLQPPEARPSRRRRPVHWLDR